MARDREAYLAEFITVLREQELLPSQKPGNRDGDFLMNLVKGQRIVLKANEAEGWSRQEAVIEDTVQMSWGRSIVVRVQPEDEFDDGLREVTEDQIGKSS